MDPSMFSSSLRIFIPGILGSSLEHGKRRQNSLGCLCLWGERAAWI